MKLKPFDFEEYDKDKSLKIFAINKNGNLRKITWLACCDDDLLSGTFSPPTNGSMISSWDKAGIEKSFGEGIGQLFMEDKS